MENPIAQRVREIMKAKGYSANSLSKLLNIPQTTISRQMRGENNISLELMLAILGLDDGLSAEWLMRGEGDMFVFKNGENHENEMIPLLPVTAQGGSLNEFVSSVMNHECERILSPIKGADMAITVSGESMSPEYPSGSQVLIKRIKESSFIEWGKVYVLDTCNGAVIKIITQSENEGYVKCVSINPDPIYASFEIALTDIYGIYRVLMCMALK